MSCFESGEDTDQCHSKVALYNIWKVFEIKRNHDDQSKVNTAFMFRKDKNSDLKHYMLVNVTLICEKIMEWVLLKHTFGHIKEEGDGE